MFALVSENGPPDTITLKGPPLENEALRSQHEFVRPGYYMNKRHWITIDLALEEPMGSLAQVAVDSPPEVPMDEIVELIQESHRLVVAGLPRRVRVELGIEAIG